MWRAAGCNEKDMTFLKTACDFLPPDTATCLTAMINKCGGTSTPTNCAQCVATNHAALVSSGCGAEQLGLATGVGCLALGCLSAVEDACPDLTQTCLISKSEGLERSAGCTLIAVDALILYSDLLSKTALNSCITEIGRDCLAAASTPRTCSKCITAHASDLGKYACTQRMLGVAEGAGCAALACYASFATIVQKVPGACMKLGTYKSQLVAGGCTSSTYNALAVLCISVHLGSG
jgi:hypothetical protein